MSLDPNSFIGCLSYGYELTPWACIQNQLGLVLEISPCWDCKRPVTIELAPVSATTLKPLSEAAIKQGRAAVKRLSQNPGFCPDSPPLPVSASQKRRTWPQGMSRAVVLAMERK